jgi:hypothetical protein
MIMPGDKLACRLDSPEGEITDTADVSNIAIRPLAPGVYAISLEFGPVNRLEIAKRNLLRRRHSSLQEVEVPKLTIHTVESLNEEGLNPVPDPIRPTVDTIGPSTITVSFGTALPDGVTGYECRTTDGSWGMGGHVQRFTSHTTTLSRNRRDVKYFFRAYRLNSNGSLTYSERSAMVRQTFPLLNTMTITGVTGSYGNTRYKFLIPIPNNPDFYGVKVKEGSTVMYYGDGINHFSKDDRVTAWPSDGKIEIQVTDSVPQASMTLTFTPVDLLGTESSHVASLTINKP